MTIDAKSQNIDTQERPNELGVTPDAPWLGLRSFTESVQDYFYGRDAEIRELFERVQHRTLTVLFGQSGLGKTSLLRAGLIPRLRAAKFTPVLIRLVHDEVAPPLEQQLISAVTKTCATSIAPLRWNSLWELFHDPACGMICSGQNPVLVIDQFEELFTQGEAKHQSNVGEFLEALACLVENRPPSAIRAAMDREDALADRLRLGPQPCKVLIALRDDFLHRLERGRRQMPSMMDNRFELRPLSGIQAFRAIHEPATKRPNQPIVNPETARAIVRFVARASSDTPLEEIDNVPPLLSLICEQLNSRRLTNRETEISAESLAESAPEVLRGFYEKAFAIHPPAVRGFVEDQLVSASGFRESKTLDTAKIMLSNANVSDAEVILRQLVDQRLLVIEDRGGIARVELTHDILAPIAAIAKKERTELQAQAEAETRLKVERHKRRLFAVVAGLMGVLLVAAVAGGIAAWRMAEKATMAAKEAKKSEAKATVETRRANDEFERANGANRRNLELLHQAETATKEAESAAKAAKDESNRANNESDRANKAAADTQIAVKDARIRLHKASLIDHASAKKALEEYYEAVRQTRWAESIGRTSKWHEAVALWTRALEMDLTNIDAVQCLYDALVSGSLENVAFVRQKFDPFPFVRGLSFSDDGARVVTIGDSGIQVLDVASFRVLGAPIPALGVELFIAGFSPDSSRIITASRDMAVRVWDITSGSLLGQPLLHEDKIRSTSFNVDGTRVLVVAGKIARIWDVVTFKPVGSALRHEGEINYAEFSPDGTRVVTASDDKSAQIWSADTGNPIGKPLRHEGPVSGGRFSPDGMQVVTASWDGTAQIWDATIGKRLGEPLRPGSIVNYSSFSPDGTRVLTASHDKTAQLWDVTTRKPFGPSLRHEGPINSARFSMDGAKILIESDDKTLRVWDVATGKPLGEPLRLDNLVLSARISANGTQVCTTSLEGTSLVWETAGDKPRGNPLRHLFSANNAVFSSDGARIVTASGSAARMWDVATGKVVGLPFRHEGVVVSAMFNPDGTRVVTASSDNTAQVWDVVTGKPVGERLRHKNRINSARFSHDGARVITASADMSAMIWDAATGEPLGRPLEHENCVNYADFSPDGAQIVTASDGNTARLWDTATGFTKGEPFRHEGPVLGVSFSPDGKRLATASGDKTARVWDASGRPLREPMRHRDKVKSVTFSPDGRCIVTSCVDGTAQVWDVDLGKPQGEPLRHRGPVNSAFFSPDALRVVTASDDKTARIWELPTVADREAIAHVSKTVINWARAISGLRFSDDGELEIIPEDERRRIIESSNLEPGLWADLDAWLKSGGADRKLVPKSIHSLRQIAERERDFGSRESLESSLQYDPTVPLSRLMLANLLEKQELSKPENERDFAVLARAAHWRRFDLDRLPSDSNHWMQAAEQLRQLPAAKIGIGPKYAVAINAAEDLVRRVLVSDEQLDRQDSHVAADHLNSLAELLQTSRRWKEAESLMRRALAIDEKTLGPGHISVARDLNKLATLLIAMEQRSDAEPLLRRSVMTYQEIDRNPSNEGQAFRDALKRYVKLLVDMELEIGEISHRLESIDSPADVAETLNIAGVSASGAGKPDKAIKFYREALRLYKTLPNETDNFFLVTINLAAAERAAGKVAEATAALESLIAELDSQPSASKFRKADARFHLALCKQERNDLASAERWVLDSIRRYDLLEANGDRSEQSLRAPCVRLYCELLIARELEPSEISKLMLPFQSSAEIAAALNVAGVSAFNAGEPEKAIRLDQEALRIYKSLPNETDNVFLVTVNLAAAMRDTGNLIEAKTALENAIAELEWQPSATVARKAHARVHMALCEQKRNDLGSAERWVLDAIRLCDLLEAHGNRSARGLRESGVQLYCELLIAKELEFSEISKLVSRFESSTEIAAAFNVAGVSASAAGKSDRAIQLYGEALSLYKSLPSETDRIFQVEINLAVEQRITGKLAEAKAALETVIAELDSLPSASTFLKANARQHLANCEQQRNDLASAERWILDSIRLYDKLEANGDRSRQRFRKSTIEMYCEVLIAKELEPAEISKRMLSFQSPAEVAMALNIAGVSASDAGKSDRAIQLYREALRLYEPLPDLRDDFFRVTINIAAVERRTGKVAEAKAALERVIAELESRPSVSFFRSANARYHLALCEQKQNNLASTERWVLDSIRLYDLLEENGDRSSRSFRESSVRLYLEVLIARELDPAEISKRLLQFQSPAEVAKALNIAGVSASDAGKSDRAIQLYREALRLYEPLPDLRDEFLLVTTNLVVEKRNTGKVAEAKSELEKVIVELEHSDTALPTQRGWARLHLAVCEKEQKNLKAAERWILEAIKQCNLTNRPRDASIEELRKASVSQYREVLKADGHTPEQIEERLQNLTPTSGKRGEKSKE